MIPGEARYDRNRSTRDSGLMSTPAPADAPPSEARCQGSSGPVRYQTPSQTVIASTSTSRPGLVSWVEVFASFGRRSPASVEPSRETAGSSRSTSAPGMVPESVPSRWTAWASSTDWRERATISLGSVTSDGGVVAPNGPKPSAVPPTTSTSTITIAAPITGNGPRFCIGPWALPSSAAFARRVRARLPGAGRSVKPGRSPWSRVPSPAPLPMGRVAFQPAANGIVWNGR